MSFKIIINEDGSVFIETEGFVGPSCVEEAERLIARLREAGVEVKTEGVIFTEEYYHAKERAKVRV